VGPRSSLAIRGWTPGMTGNTTAAMNALCTTPSIIPNHQVNLCAAWNAATYTIENAHPFRKCSTTP
jgi:hypothetical protein